MTGGNWLLFHQTQLGIITWPASCFQKGVKILCSNGLIPIENLRVNDSVKTYKHGFRKITHIGFNYGINCSDKNSIFSNMFICNTNPDFIITGGHGILLDKNEIYEKILNNHGVKTQDITHIDDKMLMVIGICPGFTEFPPGYSFTYYHRSVIEWMVREENIYTYSSKTYFVYDDLYTYTTFGRIDPLFYQPYRSGRISQHGRSHERCKPAFLDH